MFNKRITSDGMLNNNYWYGDENPYAKSKIYGMPNCTCYTFGRVFEITNSVPTYLGSGNAVTFLDKARQNGKKTGLEPKLGAVMVFGAVGTENPGHVAVVEEIYDNGDILCSNSNYNGTYFYTSKHTKASGYNNYSKDLYFKGFIYILEDEGNNNISDSTYTVVQGDTLTKIANMFNTSVDELVRINNISNRNLIITGQKLVVKGNNNSNNFNIGDKVIINGSASKYCTGEVIPNKYKNIPYSIAQVGTKKYPTGLLLSPINSWVYNSDCTKI